MPSIQKIITLLLSTISLLAINGCGQKVPCPDRKCYYPVLPTYKMPSKGEKITVKEINATHSIIETRLLLSLHDTKNYCCDKVSKTNKIHSKINKEYQ